MPVFASPVPAEMILFDVLAGSFLFPHEVVIVLDAQPEVEPVVFGPLPAYRPSHARRRISQTPTAREAGEEGQYR
jgi:hypothetical protein